MGSPEHTMVESPAHGPLRIFRTGLLVVITFALASLAHTAAGGRLPPTALLLPLAIPVACLAYVLTGRSISGRVTALLQTGLQMLLHQLFAALGGHATASTTSHLEAVLAADHGGHLHGSNAVQLSPSSFTASTPWSGTSLLNVPFSGPSTDAGLSALAPHPGFGSAAAAVMLLLHITATVLTIIALAGLERALWHVWTWLRPLCMLLLGASDYPWRMRASCIETVLAAPVLQRMGRRRRRRGPPVSSWFLSAV
ncbi:hypothetical protein [Kineococcus radiotolerans]|uniref:hypothetical protein n=1 Tax=Kineococcus radiotolerans TaxID=131568 RepID=UPI0012FEA879|nr:hypothetical protein [Kineococcus radiotolerans]